MPRQVPTPRTVEIPSAEAVAKERERLQYKRNTTARCAARSTRCWPWPHWPCWSPRFFCRCWHMN
ncbi:hypothetical protein NIA69_13075 [Gemmiger formicilis]|nr:hypothetical protein [Gemmiger formicilis]